MKMARLIPPFGGPLVDLVASAEALGALQARAGRLPSMQLAEFVNVRRVAC
jgi:hypothetical protein